MSPCTFLKRDKTDLALGGDRGHFASLSHTIVLASLSKYGHLTGTRFRYGCASAKGMWYIRI
jgi:hypothetical protein